MEYKDEHAVAHRQRDDDAHSQTHRSLRVAIGLKSHVPTLLDLDICDVRANAALLRAIQAVAFRSNMLPAAQGFSRI